MKRMHCWSCRWTPPHPEEMATYSTGSTQLCGDDIIVMNHNIDLTAGPHNPLDNVRFFENFGSTTKFSMQQRSVTGLEVENFQASITTLLPSCCLVL